MRTALFASAAALLLSLPSLAGGPWCEVAWTSPPTPGLEALVISGAKDAAPNALRPSKEQVEKLVEALRDVRDLKEALDAKAAKLPLTKAGPTLRGDLPDRVTALVGRSTRDTVLVVDLEQAELFGLARKAAIDAVAKGDDSWNVCDLCAAVRRGVEAKWAWDRAEFTRDLTADEEKLAAEIAAGRQSVREKWAAALRAELTKKQLAWLASYQEEWIAAETGRCVEAGFRAAGREACESCGARGAKKCRLCEIVTDAVERAARATRE